jgi:hypothetical protein
MAGLASLAPLIFHRAPYRRNAPERNILVISEASP